jgi:hypothetical protein
MKNMIALNSMKSAQSVNQRFNRCGGKPTAMNDDPSLRGAFFATIAQHPFGEAIFTHCPRLLHSFLARNDMWAVFLSE